jgi:hypothetical protein
VSSGVMNSAKPDSQKRLSYKNRIANC